MSHYVKHGARERERDLECARSLRVELDVERGAQRFAALIAAGAAAPIAGAGVAAGAGAGLWKGAAAKLLGALFALSATTGVAWVVHSGPTVSNGPTVVQSSPSVLAIAPSEAQPVTPEDARLAIASGAASSPPSPPFEPSINVAAPRSSGSPGPVLAVSARPAPAGAASPSPSPSPSPLATELRSLAAARAQLADSPQSALDAADAKRGGPLAEEREILAIRALVALGRQDEARTRAARFVAAHPESPFRAAAAEVATPR